MLKYLTYHPGKGLAESLDSEGIRPPRETLEYITWLDLDYPTEAEFQILEAIYHFHPLAIEDCQGHLQRPWIDDYGEYAFLITHAPAEKPGKKAFLTAGLYVFLGPNYLVTVHWEPLPFIEEVYQRIRINPDLLAKGSDFLLYTLVDTMVDDYFPFLDKIEERLETLEEQIFHRPNRQTLNRIFFLRRDLIGLRRVIAPQRDTFNLLLRLNNNLIREANNLYLLDLHNQMMRVLDMVDTFRDMASGVLEAYLSVVSNRMNEVMKTLTVITTIMMPLTVITGIYGMNFRFMPELDWRYGYYWALGWMAVVAAVMLLYFRRRRWF